MATVPGPVQDEMADFRNMVISVVHYTEVCFLCKFLECFATVTYGTP